MARLDIKTWQEAGGRGAILTQVMWSYYWTHSYQSDHNVAVMKPTMSPETFLRSVYQGSLHWSHPSPGPHHREHQPLPKGHSAGQAYARQLGGSQTCWRQVATKYSCAWSIGFIGNSLLIDHGALLLWFQKHLRTHLLWFHKKSAIFRPFKPTMNISKTGHFNLSAHCWCMQDDL